MQGIPARIVKIGGKKYIEFTEEIRPTGDERDMGQRKSRLKKRLVPGDQIMKFTDGKFISEK